MISKWRQLYKRVKISNTTDYKDLNDPNTLKPLKLITGKKNTFHHHFKFIANVIIAKIPSADSKWLN